MFDYGLDTHYKFKPHDEVKHLFSCLEASLVASDNGLPKQMLKVYTFHTLAFLNSSERKTQLLPPANEVWGKVIFLVACVKNPVYRGEYLDRYPPGRYTPGQVHPPGQVHHPSGRYTPRQVHPHPWAGTLPLGRYTPPGQVHPRAGTPPGAVYTGRYGQQAGGTHPTGIHSCFG